MPRRTAEEEAAYALFWEAARKQRACAVKGCRNKDFDPHHAILEQHLRDRGLPRYDARNSLRLCRDHHFGHHGTKKLPTTVLTQVNIDYAAEVLGDFAYDYITRRYDYSDPDPRVEAIRCH